MRLMKKFCIIYVYLSGSFLPSLFLNISSYSYEVSNSIIFDFMSSLLWAKLLSIERSCS